MTNLWYEITATTPPDQVEAVSAIMREAAPGGLTVEEPMNLYGMDEGFEVRKGEPVLLRAYLPASELGAVLTDDLRTRLRDFPAVELTASPFYEEDWAVSWREFFGVVDTGGRIVVVPSWLEHTPRPGQIPILLDPGRAFGTGHHESTRLCMAAMEPIITPGTSVLDVGTGSGILAIAAVLLGATPVLGIDIDPIAVDVARENAEENGVADRIRLEPGVLTADHEGRYKLVIANINRDANAALAPVFAAITEPGGMLILSGFLAEDAPVITGAMTAAGFALAEKRHERDWCMLGFRRNP
jgi:ribosomal protein L11 methyltransferase